MGFAICDILELRELPSQKRDFCTLGLLVDWLDIHIPFVNADRLLRVLENEENESCRAFWVSIAQRHKGDRRFASLTRKFRGKKINIFGNQSDFLIRKKGEDARFTGSSWVRLTVLTCGPSMKSIQTYRQRSSREIAMDPSQQLGK